MKLYKKEHRFWKVRVGNHKDEWLNNLWVAYVGEPVTTSGPISATVINANITDVEGFLNLGEEIGFDWIASVAPNLPKKAKQPLADYLKQKLGVEPGKGGGPAHFKTEYFQKLIGQAFNRQAFLEYLVPRERRSRSNQKDEYSEFWHLEKSADSPSPAIDKDLQNREFWVYDNANSTLRQDLDSLILEFYDEARDMLLDFQQGLREIYDELLSESAQGKRRKRRWFESEIEFMADLSKRHQYGDLEEALKPDPLLELLESKFLDAFSGAFKDISLRPLIDAQAGILGIAWDFKTLKARCYAELFDFAAEPDIELIPCANCGRLFAAERIGEKYCDRVIDYPKRTCKEIGPQRAYEKSLEEDTAKDSYRREYNRRNKALIRLGQKIGIDSEEYLTAQREFERWKVENKPRRKR